MSTCQQCGKPIPPGRKPRKFCPTGCRQAWHRAHTYPGVVTGLRQLRSGAWAVTVRYPSQPAVSVGSSVLLETEAQAAHDGH